MLKGAVFVTVYVLLFVCVCFASAFLSYLFFCSQLHCPVLRFRFPVFVCVRVCVRLTILGRDWRWNTVQCSMFTCVCVFVHVYCVRAARTTQLHRETHTTMQGREREKAF